MASGDKFYLADKPTLDEVKGKIGSTTDTGGSSTAGTVMAKENAVLGEVGKIGVTNDAQSSSTTTGSIFAKLNYLVSQVSSYLSNIYIRLGTPTDSANDAISGNVHAKLNWFLNLFGKTNDTGGSSTAGTVMAKGNAILTEVNKIGNMNDTGATATTGTVFGKLNSLILKEQKYLSRKRVISGVTSGQSNTVIDVSGSGLFFLMHKTMGNDINASIEFDGTVVNGTFQSNHCGVAVSGSNYRIYNTSIPASTVGDYYSSFSVIQFKSNLKITCTPVTNDNITVFYALYE